MEKLKSADRNSLIASCDNLAEFLKHGDISDIDGTELLLELQILRDVLPEDIKKAVDVLTHLNSRASCFPNAWVAYRILLTIPITVVSAERSFSKLKMIKSYFWSTMSQEILNGLAMLSIEKELVEKIDYTNVITDFTAKTARRINFR